MAKQLSPPKEHEQHQPLSHSNDPTMVGKSMAPSSPVSKKGVSSSTKKRLPQSHLKASPPLSSTSGSTTTTSSSNNTTQPATANQTHIHFSDTSPSAAMKASIGAENVGTVDLSMGVEHFVIPPPNFAMVKKRECKKEKQ
jgi:hypothetical protein